MLLSLLLSQDRGISHGAQQWAMTALLEMEAWILQLPAQVSVDTSSVSFTLIRTKTLLQRWQYAL